MSDIHESGTVVNFKKTDSFRIVSTDLTLTVPEGTRAHIVMHEPAFGQYLVKVADIFIWVDDEEI